MLNRFKKMKKIHIFWVLIAFMSTILLFIITIAILTLSDPTSNEFLKIMGITYWQTTVMVWYVLISTIILGYYRAIDDQKIITKAFLFVLLGGIIYLLLTGLVYNDAWVIEANFWLISITGVFMLLMIIIVPFFIFFTIIRTMVASRENKISIENMFKSFFSIWLMPLIAITIAIIMIPLIMLIPPFSINDNNLNTGDFNSELTTIPGIIFSAIPSALGMFLGVGKVLSVVFLSIFIGVILTIMHSRYHKESEQVIHTVTHMHTFITTLIRWIAMMIPMVIATRLVILFDITTMKSTFESLIIFMLIFLIGWGTVVLVELIITFLTMKNRSKKNFFRYIKDYFLTAFIKHAAAILLEETIKESKELGVSEEVAELTSSMSTSMGQSTCGGFYPAFVAIMTASMAISDGSIDPPTLGVILSFLLVMYIVIMVTNLGMTGVPGADTAVILSVLSGVGLSGHYGYFMFVFGIDGIVNHIRGIGNAFGFVAANNIAERIINTKHRKIKHKGESLYDKNLDILETYDFTKNEEHNEKEILELKNKHKNNKTKEN